MTWKSFHSHGEILREVIAVADHRRDGLLPMDLDGVAETFGDELTLLGALQLRWHTRLAGHIERELMAQPMDLEQAVVAAWQATAEELAGVRAIIDHYHREPADPDMAAALVKARAKERSQLALLAGRASVSDDRAVRAGAEIEATARAGRRPAPEPDRGPSSRRADHPRLLDRIKSALAA